MARELMKGTEAVAEAAIRAGCRFFAGYPITPQSEVLEYLSTRLPEIGGTFVQCESELSSISMVYGATACGFRALTSSSGPGFSLMQEGLSYIASADLPCVVVNIMRYGSGLGDIFIGQSDYWQAVKNGGHGDYRSIVLAPNSVQETVDLMFLAYDISEKHRMPVIVLSDASLGQMMEPVELPEMKEHDADIMEWALKGKGDGVNKRHTSIMYYRSDYDDYLREKYATVELEEQRWELIGAEDAELVLVSYGISGRICEDVISRCRTNGKKVSLIRPISLYPFPFKAFEKFNPSLGYLVVEMTVLRQMAEDVAIAGKMKKPVYDLGGGTKFYTAKDVMDMINAIYAGAAKEVY